MAEPRDNSILGSVPTVDEKTKLAGMRAAAAAAATMPKVDPKTGELPDLFAGKFGFIEALANDPVYGEEIKKIRDALIAQNKALAETLYRKSKWAQLDTDAQDAYLLKLQNNNLYKERLKSWLINIRKTLVAKGIDVSDATLEKYYVDGIDEATIIDELTPKISVSEATGAAAQNLQALRQVAKNNGLDLDADFAGQVDSWLQQISKGKSINDFAQTIRNKAAEGKSKFVQDKLKMGNNLQDIYGNYIGKISDTFGIPFETVSLNDSIFSKLFTDKGPVDNKTLLKILQSDERFSGSITGSKRAAALALTKRDLENAAKNNNIDINLVYPEGIDSIAGDITDGLVNLNSVLQNIRNKAGENKSKYVKDQLNAGNDLRSIYASYIGAMASAFNVDPETITLDDELLKNAFTDKGGIKFNEFQNLIRKDARFKETPGATSEADLRQQIADRALATGAKLSDSDLNSIVTKLLATGAGSFGQATIDAELRKFITEKPSGRAGSNLQDLQNVAAENGINLEATFGSDIQNWLQKIDQGESIDTYKKIIRTKAGEGKSKFIQNQLSQGNNLRTIYGDYISAMATAFNIPASSIDVNDSLLQQAFTDKGAIKLNEFQNLIRNDARYKGTTGAASETDFRQQIVDRAIAIGAKVADADINTIVSELLATGVAPSASAIDAKLRKFITYGTSSTAGATGTAGVAVSATGITGAAGNNLQILRDTAARNGLDLDKAFGGSIQDWLQKIDQGETIETYKRIIRDAAKMGLPDNVKKMLDQGVDLTTIFDPYRNYMGRILEINPDTIDINDPVLRSAIGPDKEMTLYDFQRALRKDPRWQYTNQARSDVSDAIRTVARDFGLAG